MRPKYVVAMKRVKLGELLTFKTGKAEMPDSEAFAVNVYTPW